MAIDIIARGLATSLLGPDGRVSSAKMPVFEGTNDLQGFSPIGKLTDPSLIEGRTAEEILLMILYGVVNPTLIDPRLTISISEDTLPLIIGRKSVLRGILRFDRGAIEPAYGTSGNRSGVPEYYTLNDQIFETNNLTFDFEFEFIPTEKQVEIIYNVKYSAGEQPLNSIGKPFDSPLPEGLLFGEATVPATYMLYDIDGKEKEFDWFTDEDGSGYISVFASEGQGIKQNFAVSQELVVIGIKAYDPMTTSWSWLGGQSAAVSLTHFDTAIILGESLGETTNYISYTHNQPASGERELRIYVM